ncbi:hypothetical protein POM88_012164 [Heracleum sosnowskyi]|uniref:Uncharacterized protein n=1 Tax=Heracleum sosnowskyi TaxID=360622 RepID=A0AAD8N339_9APIA|nr:hypothetical protein POM88_012164 [Heracleum sosnowskyi]
MFKRYRAKAKEVMDYSSDDEDDVTDISDDEGDIEADAVEEEVESDGEGSDGEGSHEGSVFLAKPKNSDAPLDLFFAEVVACGVRANEVNKCWILKPRPSPSPVAITCDYIWHPLDDEEDYMN